MTDLRNLDTQQLVEMKNRLSERYRRFRSQNLMLDMTRGKPCPEQLDLSLGMLAQVTGNDYLTADGVDCRNYGGLDGLADAKKLFAAYLEVKPDEIIISGNSSLNLMHDTILRAVVKGMTDDHPPWNNLPTVKFICPSPGYDRHFFICEFLNIEMIPVDMNSEGPDMDQVERLAAEDESIKGIWCVPKYSNPTGAVYSDDVVERLAGMKAKAADFRIFWDNAYAVHHLGGAPARLKNILAACKQAKNPDRVLMFSSTSKITFPGAGLAMIAGSVRNMERIRRQMAFQTIGPDKLNQLRHVKFFKDMAAIEDHMHKHAQILKPKFEAVQQALHGALADAQIAEWSKPAGGYFVSIDTMKGCAKSVVQMAAEAGVKLTPAGSTYPYKKDPLDRNIRIAPSFPALADIRSAMELVTICIQLVSIEKILESNHF